MSVTDVKAAFSRAGADRRITTEEVDSILGSAGSISRDEEAAIAQGARDADQFLAPDAKAKIADALREIPQWRAEARANNRTVERNRPALMRDVERRLAAGANTETFGGSKIPDAVKDLVRNALANGTLAYDVREMKSDPIFDTEHDGGITIDGKFNPYAQDQQAVDSMAFDYTELTPEKIAKDMSTVQTYNVIAGYDGTGQNQTARYRKETGTGNGRITALYDEASHSDTFARAPGGQKYANNFAILADGSVHCVPASRRTAAEPWRILTTASLARGKPMLFNGHLNMEKGVVTYVGMSGRLAKLQRDGENFIDPVAVLKAWGFKTAPNLRVTLEG